jgi:enoyl-CoA hydratase/carnithine racemase
MTPTYETILVETPAPGVGLVRLNRPTALNALNSQLTGEVICGDGSLRRRREHQVPDTDRQR